MPWLKKRFGLTPPASRNRFDSPIFFPAHYLSAPSALFPPDQSFGACYNALPASIREQVDRALELLKLTLGIPGCISSK